MCDYTMDSHSFSLFWYSTNTIAAVFMYFGGTQQGYLFNSKNNVFKFSSITWHSTHSGPQCLTYGTRDALVRSICFKNFSMAELE